MRYINGGRKREKRESIAKKTKERDRDKSQ